MAAKLIHTWTSSGHDFRLIQNDEQFILERSDKDSLGGDRWTKYETWRAGQASSITPWAASVLADGVKSALTAGKLKKK